MTQRPSIVTNRSHAPMPSRSGDVQTPRAICAHVARTGCRPSTMIEPTWGTSAGLRAGDVRCAPGVELNPRYGAHARQLVASALCTGDITVRCADFFAMPWESIVASLPEPMLIISNPPWATNAALSRIGARMPLQNVHGVSQRPCASRWRMTDATRLRITRRRHSTRCAERRTARTGPSAAATITPCSLTSQTHATASFQTRNGGMAEWHACATIITALQR